MSYHHGRSIKKKFHIITRLNLVLMTCITVSASQIYFLCKRIPNLLPYIQSNNDIFY